MTISTPVNSPDDICQLCFTKRDEHGDRRHKFSDNGELEEADSTPPPSTRPKEKTPLSKKEAAKVEALSKDPVARLQLRLIEVLTKRGMLDGEELSFIFGGTNDLADK